MQNTYTQELEKLVKSQRIYIEELEEQTLDLAQELEKYKKDAERYRWLREGDNDEMCMHIMRIFEEDGEKYPVGFLLRDEKLDERIDKMIQADKEYYAGFGIKYKS